MKHQTKPNHAKLDQSKMNTILTMYAICYNRLLKPHQDCHFQVWYQWLHYVNSISKSQAIMTMKFFPQARLEISSWRSIVTPVNFVLVYTKRSGIGRQHAHQWYGSLRYTAEISADTNISWQLQSNHIPCHCTFLIWSYHHPNDLHADDGGPMFM